MEYLRRAAVPSQKLTVVLSVILLLLIGATNATESIHIRGKRIPGHRPDTTPPPAKVRDSCYSNTSNDSLPTAHIKGSGTLWAKEGNKYIPLWTCCSSTLGNAHVAGGMWFDQADNSLHVPVCGWYYVTSQVTFQSNSEKAQQYTHTLKVERNCSTSFTYSHTTFTLTGSLDPDTSGRASTVVSDMVKICRGGRIYVSIPATNNACCPYGDESATSITAYLVRETDCSWPVTSYSFPAE